MGATYGQHTAGAAATNRQVASFSTRLALWSRNGLLVGLLLSLLLHLGGGVVAAWIRFHRAQAGGAGSPGEMEMAILTEAELTEMERAALEPELPTIPEVSDSLSSLLEAADTPVGEETPAFLEELGNLESTISTGAGDLTGDLGGGAGGGAATFFGLEAKGSRFAYIVDVSGSMGLDGRVEALQRELTRSIGGLLQSAKFIIVPYNGSAWALAGREEWIEASDTGKEWSQREVLKLSARGSTHPTPAFEIVLEVLRPRPDAIYFMTDGEFNPDVAAIIARMNGLSEIPIHCITFHSKEAEATMKRIAADSGGTYTHVAGPNG